MRLTKKDQDGTYSLVSKVPSEYSRFELFQIIGGLEDKLEAMQERLESVEEALRMLPSNFLEINRWKRIADKANHHGGIDYLVGLEQLVMEGKMVLKD